MSALVADGALLRAATATPIHAVGNAELVARIERLPVTPRLMLVRVIVGIATFFDAYTVLAIAFAMPQLVSDWKLTPTEVGMIISAGYIGQLFGAVLFGSLASGRRYRRGSAGGKRLHQRVYRCREARTFLSAL
jgi:putative MFS transporter